MLCVLMCTRERARSTFFFFLSATFAHICEDKMNLKVLEKMHTRHWLDIKIHRVVDFAFIARVLFTWYILTESSSTSNCSSIFCCCYCCLFMLSCLHPVTVALAYCWMRALKSKSCSYYYYRKVHLPRLSATFHHFDASWPFHRAPHWHSMSGFLLDRVGLWPLLLGRVSLLRSLSLVFFISLLIFIYFNISSSFSYSSRVLSISTVVLDVLLFFVFVFVSANTFVL